MTRPPLIVAVTGGIGCGKSAAAEMFAERSAAVIDTDAIAHELTQPGQPALQQIARHLGAEFLNAQGGLDRPLMRKRVFADAEAKRALERILHPLIREEVRRRVGTITAPYVLILIPLFVETGGYPDLVQRVLVVDCDEAVQIGRVMARSQLTEDQVRAIMRTQASRQQRLAIADDVIDNSGDLDNLRRQVETLDRRYRQPDPCA